ncbi:MAG: phosphopantothenoylcysteine decarboxylase [Candidatus Brocadiales bacterium]|nr:phosphopantothenoylcysteine decarboxylase [Candidatus Bathyanammoxibius amoris]
MNTLSGKKVLVTSGPTRVPLDDVRFISSRSSGRLGVEIARELVSRGAEVTFLYGSGSMRPDSDEGKGVRLIEVETVDELIRAVKDLGQEAYDAIFHAMAVSDFAPENTRTGKVSTREEEAWEIRLVKTPKVIGLIRETWPGAILAGFKLEAGRGRKELLVEKARELISSSGADLVIANDLTEIKGDRHVAYIVSKTGEAVETAHTKKEIAAKLVRLTEDRLR